jgi:predicted DNA-binding transcriptional regulator AlpA
MKLVNIEDVAILMGCSVPTIRRRMADARAGKSSFPLPIHGSRKRGLWRKDDIEMWSEASPDTPSVPCETPATRQRHLKIIHNELREKFGVEINGKGNEGNKDNEKIPFPLPAALLPGGKRMDG